MGKSIVIVGAGIAGLSTGCYARMNGYKTAIFNVVACFNPFYEANLASGVTVLPVAYMLLCVRFTSLLPISVQHSIRVAG